MMCEVPLATNMTLRIVYPSVEPCEKKKAKPDPRNSPAAVILHRINVCTEEFQRLMRIRLVA